MQAVESALGRGRSNLSELVTARQPDAFRGGWGAERELAVQSSVLPGRGHRHLGSKVHAGGQT